MTEPIAHVRSSDGQQQLLREHLQGVAEMSRRFASKLGLDHSGELIGLAHDLGKYSRAFQSHLQSPIGISKLDDDQKRGNR